MEEQTQRVVFDGREEEVSGKLLNVCVCVHVSVCLVVFVWLKLASKRQLAVYRLRIEMREELRSHTY